MTHVHVNLGKKTSTQTAIDEACEIFRIWEGACERRLRNSLTACLLMILLFFIFALSKFNLVGQIHYIIKPTHCPRQCVVYLYILERFDL